MQTRREFLSVAVAAGALATVGIPAWAQVGGGSATNATAITQVFGDGVKLTAVAVEYTIAIHAGGLSPTDFSVEGRTIVDVFPSSSSDPADRAEEGRFVIIALSPEDAGASLGTKADGGGKPPGGSGGPGKAGDISTSDTVYRTPAATIVQTGSIGIPGWDVAAANPLKLATSSVKNLIVDDFRQLEFTDPQTGRTLKCNLFVPRGYDAALSYPLVLFMHDAGATSDVTRTTLFQGLGAIAWASPEDQAARPCFVLAPQYAEIIADDDSKTSTMLDTTIHLIDELAGKYAIDRTRIYATGQSGGCMMSIAMNIKYPEFFAASFLVAGQWDPALVKPLAAKKLWIMVSQDDEKAWPGENAITGVLESEGTKISRAIWDGTWTSDEFKSAFEKIDAEGSPVNYTAFRKGTVIPPGQTSEGASGHRNTWRVAYTIESIREWIFRQTV